MGALSWAKGWLANAGITQEVLYQCKPHEKLVPPGKIVYLHFDSGKGTTLADCSPVEAFDELPFSPTALTDHWPGLYEKFLEMAHNSRKHHEAMAGHQHTFISTWFSTPTWCQRCKGFIKNPFSPNGYICSFSSCELKICTACKI